MKYVPVSGYRLKSKQTMIEQLMDTYPVERICAVLDCPRGSYYDQASERDDISIVEAAEQLLLCNYNVKSA